MRATQFSSKELAIDKVKTNEQASSNCLYVNPVLYGQFLQNNLNRDPVFVKLNDFVFKLKADREIPEQSVGIPGVIRSSLKLSPIMDKPILSLYDPPKEQFMLSSLTFGVTTPTLKDQNVSISEEKLITLFKENFKGHFVGSGQEFFAKLDGVDYVLKIGNHEFVEEKFDMNFGMFFEETHMEFKSKSNQLKIISSSMKEKSIFAKKFKFEDIGVGGLDKEII